THSLVAYVRGGHPRVIADCDGELLLPSVVTYGPAGVVVGTKAKLQACDSPRDTIVSVKRFMGRGADDPETRRLGPYDFAARGEAQSNVVRFQVQGTTLVTPVEVSAEILRTLKRRAEDELRSVGGAVVTVPAYFDDAQRQATKDAARLAGLEVLRLLNEPTAAALAYGLEKRQNGTFAVYDLGGGTFDITVLVLDQGVFQVKATGGDSALGGDDMDRAIAQELFEQLGTESEPALVRRILDDARGIKHALTESEEVEREVLGRAVRMTRPRFEALVAPLLGRTGAVCRRVLRDAGVRGSDLDGVILVGGATRVPCVRAYVRELFEQEPRSDVDPDQVVALGAAIQADLLAGQGVRDDVLLLDVIPLSLGLEVGGGVVDKILPRNTTIPAAARATYTTQEDRQTGFEIHVVQGEREMVRDARSLARFTLKGIPPMPAGLAKLEVTFRVDADGLLSVEAREQTTGIAQRVQVKPSYGLDDQAVEKMLLEALDHGEEDLVERQLAQNRIEAHRILASTAKALQADRALLHAGEELCIANAMEALTKASKGNEPALMHARMDALDLVSKASAERRMNRAIALAIEGRRVDEVASEVSS
ncbi:MAG: Fe-S protein assembly chaperone HscA, partial [Myxococcales bacterium]